jgi:hypothetical protein
MDNTQLDDLKQFILATVSQATANMATKDDIADMATKGDIQMLKGDIKRLEVKIDDLDLKVDTIADTLNDHLNDHELRLTKLEQHTA